MRRVAAITLVAAISYGVVFAATSFTFAARCYSIPRNELPNVFICWTYPYLWSASAFLVGILVGVMLRGWATWMAVVAVLVGLSLGEVVASTRWPFGQDALATIVDLLRYFLLPAVAGVMLASLLRPRVRVSSTVGLIGLLLMPAVAVAYHVYQRGEQHRSVIANQFATTVNRIRAVQVRRDAARRCVSDLKDKVPALMNDKPTLIFLGADGPVLRPSFVEMVYDRWKDRGLNGVWVHNDEQRGSPLTEVSSPVCMSFIPPNASAEWIVLDRDGQLFWAGQHENFLKQALWIADPTYTPSPNFALGGMGMNLLLESGQTLLNEETVMMVTWATQCKWYFGQCLFVNSQIASMKRLDDTTPEILAKEGLAELEATGWLDRK